MKMNGQVRSRVWRRRGEQYLPECHIPKMLSFKESCMVWAAIWHGGRLELVRFDTSQSEGRRKGITGKLYLEQITQGPLKQCWCHMTSWWRGYGHPGIVEDGAPIHIYKKNRDTGRRQGFKYMTHPPLSLSRGNALPSMQPTRSLYRYTKRVTIPEMLVSPGTLGI